MYTGIVQGLEQVIEIRKGDGFITLLVSDQHGFFADVFIGASVAVNGVCLTVTTIDRAQKQIHFDISNIIEPYNGLNISFNISSLNLNPILFPKHISAILLATPPNPIVALDRTFFLSINSFIVI